MAAFLTGMVEHELEDAVNDAIRAGVLLTVVLLAACRANDEAAPAAVHEPAVAVAEDTAAVTVVPPERMTLPPYRIYYTLTSYAWYARGEPLIHDARAYYAAGWPVAASAAVMELLGEYQGVSYYARRGDTNSVVYVPVFEGYWQPFRADPAPRVAD
jgi:hypothetical protein